MPSIRASTFLLVVLAAILVVAALQAATPAQTPATQPRSTESSGTPTAAPPASPEPTIPTGSTEPSGTPAATPGPPDPQAMRVNELGTIPVLMYHTFTTGDATNIWMRNLTDFWNDLFWLYDHDFYVISLRDLVDNTIDVPAGKHPVVLTFDDASDSQFQFVVGADGDLEPSPFTAVGVLESFFADYPDFGRGGHFAVTAAYCFANVNDPAGVNTYVEHCPKKLQWLSDHGYEVGNHTWSHPNLATLSGAGVNEEVGSTSAFIANRVTGPGNQGSILTLPYGGLPAEGSEGYAAIMNGPWWDGAQYPIDAMTLVDGGPMYSPSSSWFNPYRIKRFNTDPASLEAWFGKMERGEIPLYTSDGDPDTVTIPDPMPESLQNELDPAIIAASGKELLTYADDGTYAEPKLTARPEMEPGVLVVTNESGVRLRGEPSTKGDPVKLLKHHTPLTVLGGPKKGDGHTWWEVRMEDGTEGWVAEEFLAGPPRTP